MCSIMNLMNDQNEFNIRLDSIPVKLDDLPNKEIFLIILNEKNLILKNSLIAKLLLDQLQSKQTDSKFYLAISELPGINNELRSVAIDLMLYFEEGSSSGINIEKLTSDLKNMGDSINNTGDHK